MWNEKNILSLIGNTPLLKLNKFIEGLHFNLYAKMEAFNPGGSIKVRPAIEMVKDAIDKGLITKDTTIVESSSGNLGVALSMICSVLGIKFICVTDIRSTKANRQIIKAYGTTLDMVEEADPEIGTFLAARIKRVNHLLEITPNSFSLNQYENPNNPISHHTTVKEVLDELDNKLDYLFCSTSTCGTLRGTTDFLSEHGHNTKVVAVDAVGSVIFGDSPAPRLIPGHGAGVMPAHYKSGIEHSHILVTDSDCVAGCHQLVRTEGIFAGGSSGAGMAAIMRLKDQIPAGANCVVVLCDHGSRYLDTIYDEAWVVKHFGEKPVLMPSVAI